MFELFKKLVFNGLGSVGLKFSGLFISIYAARTLSLDDYGFYGIAVSTIVLFGTTYVNVIAQYVSAFQVNVSSGILDKSHVFAIGTVFTAIYIATVLTLLHALDFVLIDASISVALVIVCFCAPVVGFIFKESLHKAYAKFSLLALAIFLLVFYGFSTQYSHTTFQYILLYSLPYFIASLFMFIYILIKYTDIVGTYKIVVTKAFFLQLCQFSKGALYLFFASAIVPLCFWLLYNVFDYKLGRDNIGLFVSLMQWTWIVSQLSVVVSNVFISKMRDEEETPLNRFQNLYASWLPATFIVCFIVSLYEVHFFLFGDNFNNEALIQGLAIVLTVSVLSAFKSFIYRIILKFNQNYLSMLSNLLWLTIFVATVYLKKEVTFLDFCYIYAYSSFISFLVFLPIYIKFKYFSLQEVFLSKCSLSLILMLVFSIVAMHCVESMEVRALIYTGMLGCVSFIFYKKINLLR